MSIIPFSVMSRVRTLAAIALFIVGGISIGYGIGSARCLGTASAAPLPIDLAPVKLPPVSALPVSFAQKPWSIVTDDPKGNLNVVCDAGCVAKYHVASDGKTLLPDERVTPGEVRLTSAAAVCSVKWGRDERHVTQKMKLQVCAAYGIAAKDCNGKNYEIDHLISRELGGADTIANLWPQPIAQARLKDRLENALHRDVCDASKVTGASRLDLKAAQNLIARNWYSQYVGLFGGGK